MGKAFPTDKDNIIDRMEDDHKLNLSEAKYNRLRKLTTSELFLVQQLLSRAEKCASKKDDQ